MGKLFAIRRFSFCEWKIVHFILVKFRGSLIAGKKEFLKKLCLKWKSGIFLDDLV